MSKSQQEDSIKDKDLIIFKAIWEVIKHWEIRRSGPEIKYSSVTGKDVTEIINAIRPFLRTE